jgi:hypothetical protein
MLNGPGLPEVDFSGMPTTPITISSSADSAGLELAFDEGRRLRAVSNDGH